jgi:Mg2+/Co2+ transporter CorB
MPDLTPLACIIGVIGCLLLMALFSASEAALAATNRVRLRQLLRAQAPSEEGALSVPAGELTREAQRFIATITIAANVPSSSRRC